MKRENVVVLLICCFVVAAIVALVVSHHGKEESKIGNIRLFWDNQNDLLIIQNSEPHSVIRDLIIEVDRGPVIIESIPPEITDVFLIAENIIEFNGDLLGTWRPGPIYIRVILANATYVEVDDFHGGTDILGGHGAEKVGVEL